MSVQLYVYDLSKGLAKQMSLALVGKQIDGVWHTSVVHGGVEYFYGAGVQTCAPGQSHHGRPLEVVEMGTTALPQDVVVQYVDSLRTIYTAEKYDLFMHNCNNFSQDLCQFLVGRNIPAHISSLPQEVLNTPFGQMMRPAIESSLRPVTTAPTPASAPAAGHGGGGGHGDVPQVLHPSTVAELERLIADSPAAAVFFTSATCAPCKMAYPMFNALAERYDGKCVFAKIDVHYAYEIGQRFQISATPTFKTYVKGEPVDEWRGANPSTLESNVNMLVAMAHPPHAHRQMDLPKLLGMRTEYIKYAKVPPMDAIAGRLETAGCKPSVVDDVLAFVATRQKEGAASAPLPDLAAFVLAVRALLAAKTPAEVFPLIDLVRVAALDARVCAWLAEEAGFATTLALVERANADAYQVRLLTLQLVCNLFTSTLFPPQLCGPALLGPVVQLVCASLLDEHTNVRVAAGSLMYNLCCFVQRQRTAGTEAVGGETVMELAVALVEGISNETESTSTLGRLLAALGLLVYCAPGGDESALGDVMLSLDAPSMLRAKAGSAVAGEHQALCGEIAQLVAQL
ncbi:PPPDE putative peptidase domain-containing protein [Dipodascopsis tothii]|uniref:PPPDE putative peptidase domain-containing protein n=1 Tax=Dipodascopsis tothii TaxID=44089 RepID=UPI0034D00D72